MTVNEKTYVIAIVAFAVAIGCLTYEHFHRPTDKREPDVKYQPILPAKDAAKRAEEAKAKERQKSVEELRNSVQDDIKTASKYGSTRTVSVIRFISDEVVNVVVIELKQQGYRVLRDEEKTLLYIIWEDSDVIIRT